MAEVLSPFIPHNDMSSRPITPDNFPVPATTSPKRQTQAFRKPQSTFGTNGGTSGYRSVSTTPLAPYTFKANTATKADTRSVSAPMLQPQQPLAAGSTSTHNRQRYPAPDSISSISSVSSVDTPGNGQVPYSKDDALLFTNYEAPTLSDVPEATEAMLTPAAQNSHGTAPSPSRSIPDRFRRGHRRQESSVASAGSDASTVSVAISTASIGHIFQRPQQVSLQSPMERSTDPFSEIPRRFRGNSIRSMDGSAQALPGSPLVTTQTVPSAGAFVQNSNPHDARPPSSNQFAGSSSSGTRNVTSPDALRRSNTAPLPSSASQPHFTATPAMSPAVAAMAALNERDSGKSVKSRLRRAFSFGSAADLRATSGEQDTVADRAKARQEDFSSRLGDEQQTAGRGHNRTNSGHSISSIYGAQNPGFAASTDNLSISSTASSASLMLRKMGTGMRKSGRSLKGLFRPKSVVGVSSVDASMHASVGPVMMVNAEAERSQAQFNAANLSPEPEQVNVNADPHTHPGGGTGFPKLEQNSMDAMRQAAASPDCRDSESRKSFIEGEQERVEVMASVKRGILKRSATAPVQASTLFSSDGVDDRTSPNFAFNQDRHRSSISSNISIDTSRPLMHKRTDSNNDYFTGRRWNGQRASKSLPGTPQGSGKNISFSPRIQFHDVWSASDYDRRGDVATCNRLTPLLAQQIKEELNNFKMEMEVHELSKTYTHFF